MSWDSPYHKTRYACFDCRVAFKNVDICPHCLNNMAAMSKKWRVPLKSQKKKWKESRKFIVTAAWKPLETPKPEYKFMPNYGRFLINPIDSNVFKHQFKPLDRYDVKTLMPFHEAKMILRGINDIVVADVTGQRNPTGFWDRRR